MDSLTSVRLGMSSEISPRRVPAAADGANFAFSPSRDAKDYFTVRDGHCYAGTHLIVDLWGGNKLDDIEHIRRALKDAAYAAGATLLDIHLHRFSPNGGVSGVAVLAESHISIHTWPERSYAALDLFMCGKAEPYMAIPVMQEAFEPASLCVGEHLRGRIR